MIEEYVDLFNETLDDSLLKLPEHEFLVANPNHDAELARCLRKIKAELASNQPAGTPGSAGVTFFQKTILNSLNKP